MTVPCVATVAFMYLQEVCKSSTQVYLSEVVVLLGTPNFVLCVFLACVLQLYTAAINACMTDDHTNFDAAFEIYTTMQRHGVEPDDLLYGHLIAIAGRCRKLEVGLS